ncbi:MAG: ferredoxin [Myxococcota bacterium]
MSRERRSLRLDAALCSGHGRCYVLAPEVFGEDERGHCVLLVEQVEGDSLTAALSGEQNCPEGAISLHEAP